MKLIMTKGLPGSGKSTWAKWTAKQFPNTKRINKDDLRKMLDDGKWSKNNEKFVLQARNYLVESALRDGFNVIVDDTNLAPKHEIYLRSVAKAHDAEFVLQDFTDVPIEECIKRDLLRLESVGEAVIRKQYKQFLAPPPVVVEFDPKLPTAIMCDIDGTLALFGDANPYDRDFLQDKVNLPVVEILDNSNPKGILAPRSVYIILLSGRKDTFRKPTEQWLATHSIPYDDLFMRKGDDNRPDFIIKEEIYNAQIKGKYNVLFVLDDRNQVVDLWRRLGLTCLQVAEGNF